MPDWDEPSPQLEQNIIFLLTRASLLAPKREEPTLEMARTWHRDLLEGLTVPSENFRGAFRGEPGLEGLDIKVGDHQGVLAGEVATQLTSFQSKLQRLVEELDRAIRPGSLPGADQLAATLELCAWTHAEWVRIHPFANANGRIARLWVNSLAMRYGLPPFLRLRPRPLASYGHAASRAMEGDWRPTALLLHQLFAEFDYAL